MNRVNPGEVFKLGDLVDYKKGEVVKLPLINNEGMRFVIMAYDDAQLPEHEAPGDAILFALEGEAVISYEGKEEIIKAGEQYHFAKGHRHSVKADDKFKMAIMMNLGKAE